MAHEVGDRARHPAPWRGWNKRIEVAIDVKMPAMILEQGARVVNMLRMLRLSTLLPHGEKSRWSPANGTLTHHNGLDNGSAKPTDAAAAKTGFISNRPFLYCGGKRYNQIGQLRHAEKATQRANGEIRIKTQQNERRKNSPATDQREGKPKI